MNRLGLERYHYLDVYHHIATIQWLVSTLCGAIRGGQAVNASIRLGKVSPNLNKRSNLFPRLFGPTQESTSDLALRTNISGPTPSMRVICDSFVIWDDWQFPFKAVPCRPRPDRLVPRPASEKQYLLGRQLR